MDLTNLGHAVIVNNVATEMPGLMEDVAALKQAYDAIGFDVQIHTDYNAKVPISLLCLTYALLGKPK